MCHMPSPGPRRQQEGADVLAGQSVCRTADSPSVRVYISGVEIGTEHWRLESCPETIRDGGPLCAPASYTGNY
jgi:hypothetical protein